MHRPSPRHLRVPHAQSPHSRPLRRERVLVALVGLLGVVALTLAGILPLHQATALRQGQAVWSVKCNHTHSGPR
jgi:NhaP-type Na+/H+ or K+/H+ antiporter